MVRCPRVAWRLAAATAAAGGSTLAPACCEERKKGVVFVAPDMRGGRGNQGLRGLLLAFHGQGLRHAVEVRRSSTPGACFVDRRIHEYVEDVLNSGGRAANLEKAFSYRCVDAPGQSLEDVDVATAAAKVRNASAGVDLLAAVPSAFEELIPFADQLSSALSLPLANDASTSRLRVDKFQMQQAVRERCGVGVRQTLAASVPEALAGSGGIGYPMIVKPVNSAASDGLFLCRSEAELKLAVQSNLSSAGVFQQKKTAVVLQEYLQGEHFVVNSISLDGTHLVQDLWRDEKICSDREIFYGHQTLVDAEEHRDVLEFTYQALDAVGLGVGAAHLEVVRTREGVRLVEINPRTAGHEPRATQIVGHDQYTRLAQAVLRPGDFLEDAAKPDNARPWPNGSMMVVFLRAPADAEVPSAELLKIVELPTFRSFDRAPVAMLEEVLANYPFSFWIAARTRDLFTVPMAVLLAGPEEALDRDLRRIRDLEMTTLYQRYGSFDPVACAGVLTGGDYDAWKARRAELAAKRNAEKAAETDKTGTAPIPPTPPNDGCISTSERGMLRLGRFGLRDLPKRFEGGFGAVQDWSRVLSLGEQQRLAAARCLTTQPRFVVLDEATSALPLAAEKTVYD
ncbi:ddaF, partial [Symbiodinium necroappetens]